MINIYFNDVKCFSPGILKLQVQISKAVVVTLTSSVVALMVPPFPKALTYRAANASTLNTAAVEMVKQLLLGRNKLVVTAPLVNMDAAQMVKQKPKEINSSDVRTCLRIDKVMGSDITIKCFCPNNLS